MHKSATRPVNLDFITVVRQPLGAVVSITHRVTGAALALLTPFALWALHTSLSSEAGFESVRSLLASVPGRALVLFALWMLIQHLYSGIRHLFMDIDVGVELPSARKSAMLTFIASVITVAIVAVLL